MGTTQAACELDSSCTRKHELMLHVAHHKIALKIELELDTNCSFIQHSRHEHGLGHQRYLSVANGLDIDSSFVQHLERVLLAVCGCKGPLIQQRTAYKFD